MRRRSCASRSLTDTKHSLIGYPVLHSLLGYPALRFACLATSLLLFILAVNAPQCKAANSFGELNGGLTVQSGDDGQPVMLNSLGHVGSTAGSALGTAEASLTTAQPTGNVFTFDATATSSSTVGSSEVKADLNFQQFFDVSEPMRIILEAVVVNAADDFGALAQVVVNDGNEALSLLLATDTDGLPAIASTVFQPVTDPAETGIHRVSGLIFTSGSEVGTHTGSIVGSTTVTLPADLNGDLTVDSQDLALWEDGYGRPDADFSDGDIDGNRQVNGSDFLIWQSQSGRNATSDLFSIHAIPEPASASLVLLAAVCGCLCRRNSRSRLV